MLYLFLYTFKYALCQSRIIIKLPLHLFKIEHNFPRRILKACNEIVKFFKKSHQGKALLESYAKDLKIKGGGLKTWVETRWTTMFESVDSI